MAKLQKFSALSKFEGNTAYDNFMKMLPDYLNHAQFSNSKLQLKDNHGLLFDTTVPYNEKSAKMHKLLLSAIHEISGQKFDENIGIMAYAKNPMVQWAYFSLVDLSVSAILPDSLLAEVGAYTDVIFADYGETVNLEFENNSLYDVYKVGRDRRHVEQQTEHLTNRTLNPTPRAISVKANLYKILTGKQDFGKFIMKAAASLSNQMALEAYQTMDTAMGLLSDTGDNTLRYAGYDEDNLLLLCQTVEAWNSGAYTVIAGTKRALGKVLPATTELRIQIDSPYVSTGYIREFKGYDLFEMKQKADWKTEFKLLLDDTKLYVISPASDKLVKMAVEGRTTTVTDGVYDNADLSQNATIGARWDVQNFTNSIAGVMTGV